MFQLSDEKQKILSETGHMLITGGPGSGKTTMALLKAKSIVESGILQDEQSVLLLSFARSTIARIEQHSKTVINRDIQRRIEITTYHSFTWSILRSHGYLLNAKKIRILLPHEASVILSKYKNKQERENEKRRLFNEEGRLHFDLFAEKCHEILSQSDRLLQIFSAAYPVMILDEFQDTNANEWNLIKTLGNHSTLIALADPEQRIYDFRGADPARIRQFIGCFSPKEFDFGTENNRSSGTDIVRFGNELLVGRNLSKKYTDVSICTYDVLRKNIHLLRIKWFLLTRIKALIQEYQNNWSIAVLVPTNSLMITISDMLGKTQKLANGRIVPSIEHEVSIESAGPALAATFVAHLLEFGSQDKCHFSNVTEVLCEHILGRKGDKVVTKNDSTLATALKSYIDKKNYDKPIRGSVRQKIMKECQVISDEANALILSGDAMQDWVSVRDLLSEKTTPCLAQIHSDSFFVKLFHKGTLLNSSLGQIWRQHGNYTGATTAVRNALTQEHFASSLKVWRGVNVMTIHKSKGKEFDEVLVFEGAFQGQRFIYSNADLDKTRINLRVAATRAKRKTYFITPRNNPCPLLLATEN